MTDRLQKQMDFLLEIDKAKSIFRQTYLADGTRKENDAEHSWHIAIMAFTLQEYFGDDIDVLKVIKMLLMHDIIEIYAGDTYCYDAVGYLDKAERELASAKKIYALLPEDQRDEYMALWREFEAEESPEAAFAVILDRIQPLLIHFAAEGKSWREHGIHRSQVMKRNAFTFAHAPAEIQAFVLHLIDESVKRGYLAEDEPNT